MRKLKWAIGGAVAASIILFHTQASAQMIRFIALWEVPGDNGTLDEWYRHTHSQEVLERVGPWLRRYWTYRSHMPGPEVDRFNVTRYRVTEMWYDSVESRDEAQPNMGALSPSPRSQPEPGDKTLIGQIFVPANPTERFVPFIPPLREQPYFRWLMVLRYPEGVLEEDGDAWYTKTHAPELAKTPGLLRFVSHRAVLEPSSRIRSSQGWARYSELWFDSYADWKKVFLDAPQEFTKPPWGGEFPFAEIISTFTSDRPDMDFLQMKRRTP